MSNGITSLRGAFAGAVNLTQIPSNISGIVDTSYMLSGATSYNGSEIETWDFTDTVNMSGMLDDCGLEPETYNSFIMTLADWVTETGASGRVLGAANVWWGDVELSGYTYSGVVAARTYLEDTASWTFSGDTEAMTLAVDTDAEDGTELRLMLQSVVDCVVYWGDGDKTSVSGNININPYSPTNYTSHTYEVEGEYTCHIVGLVTTFGYNVQWHYPVWLSHDMIEVRSFGEIGTVNILSLYERRTIPITYLPKKIPSTLRVLNRIAWKINGGMPLDPWSNIQYWDISNLTTIHYFFADNSVAELDISSWEFTSAQDLYGFFAGVTSNNIDITSLNNTYTSNLIRLENFAGRVTDGSNAWFNKPLEANLFDNVTNLHRFAYNNYFFNQPIPSNVSKAVDLRGMFHYAKSFDQNLGGLLLRKAGVNMATMLDECGMSVENYSRTLIGWANYVWNGGAPNGPFGVTLGAKYMAHDTTTYGEGHFTDAATARAWLTTAVDPEDATVGAGWDIQNDFRYEDMTTLEFVVTEGNLGITLNPRGTGLSYRVDNGDGSAGVRLYSNGNVWRTLAEAGTFEVKVAGNYQQWGNTTATANIAKLSRVLKISELVTALPGAWRDATTLTEIPENVDWVTDVSYMLSGATAYSGVELSTWDVTQWTNAEHVLDGTAIDVSGYDTILSGWAAMVDASGATQEITVGVDGLVYSATGSGYVDTLESYSWTFSGHSQEII